jgi:fructokinase
MLSAEKDMHDLQPGCDLLAVGEILVDLISTDYAEKLEDARVFERLQGGSPANLAVNAVRLGARAALAAKAGEDAFGHFLKHSLESSGVDTRYLALEPGFQTSLVFVARTTGTPDFQPYRSADYHLNPQDIPPEAIASSRVVHTTTWPLSRQPSRSTVLDALQSARQLGKVVSFDPNFSLKVWPDLDEARQVMTSALQSVTHTKASLDDARRFFGGDDPPEEYCQRFHDLGPGVVVFTMGKAGSLVSQNGMILERLPARPVEVIDATGAGDSFWAGFLVALLDDLPLEMCLQFAREVVEIKLQTIGTLPEGISKEEILRRI